MKRFLPTPIKSSLLVACLTAGVGAFAQIAPVANDASDIMNHSCNANWGAVSGATGYRLDVSTQPDFSAGVPLPWINEFKYNAVNNTATEFFEVVIPTNYTAGTNLMVKLYDNNGNVYATSAGSEWTTGMNSPLGHTVKYMELDLQVFGATYMGGIALSHEVGGEEELIQFISYGSFPITGAEGPAAGITSQQVPSPSLDNHSSRLMGTGGRYLDFTWETGTVSKGLKNNNQTLTEAAQYPAFIAPYDNFNCGNVQQIALNGLQSGVKYYYRLRAEGASTSPHSNVVAFQTLAPHVWSNNIWMRNGEQTAPPTINDDVIIEDDFVFGASGDGTFAARSLTILSGSLIVTSGNNLQVRRGVANYMSEEEFVIEHNANLIQENSEIVNIGNATVKRNSNPLYRFDYTIWSSPVAGQNLQNFSPLTMSDRFYSYDSGISDYVHVDVTEDFAAGKGYLIRMPDTWPIVPGYDAGTAPVVFNGEFRGVPHNGTVIVPVVSVNERINMVGNPYPSPINVHAFFDNNIMNLESGTPIWVWRKRNNSDATSFATITKAGYTANYALGGDTSNGQFNSNMSETWVLNPGQGFYVQAKPGAAGVLFTNTMRRAVNNNQFFRMNNDGETTTDEQPVVSRLRFNMQGATENQGSQAIVAYSDETTNDIDYGWDGYLWSNGSVRLFTTVNEQKMSIQARASFTPEDVVALGYRVDDAGTFTISLDQLTGVFEAEQDVLLKDNMTGETHNLKEGEYTFTTEAGTFPARFDIMYTNSALGFESPVAEINSVVVYKNGNTININSGSLEMAGVTIYDIRGSVIYDNQGLNGTEASINSLASSQQVLLVQVSTETGGKVTKKIIF